LAIGVHYTHISPEGLPPGNIDSEYLPRSQIVSGIKSGRFKSGSRLFIQKNTYRPVTPEIIQPDTWGFGVYRSNEQGSQNYDQGYKA
jgi:hypothetical protein